MRRSFREKAQVLTPKNLKLPFWLFNFEETVDVFFRGRPGLEEEVEILSHVIPLAKAQFSLAHGGGGHTLRKIDPTGTAYTVDTPVPYRLSDLVALIDERMGKLENRSSATKYGRLISRIETVRKDLRYAFMFDNANVGGDTMADVLNQLFRLVPEGKPMTVMQLAGFPAEVVDSVVSVLGRMAFEFGLWSDGALELLFVCEEAHRYAPGDKSIGFGPTRKAVSRIAKEGRKYGVFLGLVTQRAAELDATIISQCSTLFAMRMANERDQQVIRSAVSDAAASLLEFLPSLGTREAFAFGEGVRTADAPALQPARRRAHTQERVGEQQRTRRFQHGGGCRLHRARGRALARRHHGQQAQDWRKPARGYREAQCVPARNRQGDTAGGGARHAPRAGRGARQAGSCGPLRVAAQVRRGSCLSRRQAPIVAGWRESGQSGPPCPAVRRRATHA